MALKAARAALLLSLGLCAAATETTAFSVGDKVQSNLVIEGKQIPLPRGEWLVAGASVQEVKLVESGPQGAVRTVILAQILNGKLSALAEINANLIPVENGWGQSGACAKGDQFLLVTRYRSDWDLSCVFVVATALADASGPAAWTQARSVLSKANVVLPETALTAGFRASDRQDVVELRLHFNPALLSGVPSRDASVWTADSVKTRPAQRRAVETLSAWALGVDGWIDRGLGNEAAREPIEGPQRTAILSETPLTDRKLADLEALYNRGAIDVASLGKQEMAALSERPVLTKDAGGLSASVRKAVSYRFFSAAVDYVLAYAVTLGGPVSAGVAASIVTVHSIIFVVNDQLWDGYYAWTAKPDASRVIDFVHIGQTR